MDATLYDLHLYYNAPIVFGKLRPIIGNFETRMATALAWLIGKNSVIIRGASGSAKSEILKATVTLAWGDEGLTGIHRDVYMIDASSDKGNITKDAIVEMRNSGHCFIPELQNCGNQEDIIKKWTEGMPYVYRRAKNGGASSSKLILPPLPILTNLADGNEKMPELANEMRRRFLSVWTVANRDVNEIVHEQKAFIDALPEEEIPSINEDRLTMLRNRLYCAMEDDRRVINPFGIELHKILPKTFTESNTYVEYLLNFVKTITKFYADQRHTDGDKLFSTAGDNYVATIIAGGIFKSLSMGVPEFAKQIVDGFEILPPGLFAFDSKDEVSAQSYYMTVDQVKDYIDTEIGMSMKKSAVKEILDKCVEVGHLRASGSGKSYYKTKEFEEVANVDVPTMVKRGVAFMEEHYPDDVDTWSKNIYDYIHPFTGEVAKIGDGHND